MLLWSNLINLGTWIYDQQIVNVHGLHSIPDTRLRIEVPGSHLYLPDCICGSSPMLISERPLFSLHASYCSLLLYPGSFPEVSYRDLIYAWDCQTIFSCTSNRQYFAEGLPGNHSSFIDGSVVVIVEGFLGGTVKISGWQAWELGFETQSSPFVPVIPKVRCVSSLTPPTHSKSQGPTLSLCYLQNHSALAMSLLIHF